MSERVLPVDELERVAATVTGLPLVRCSECGGRQPFRQCRLWLDADERSWFMCEACFQATIRPLSERLAAPLVPDALRLLREHVRSDDPEIAAICRDGLARYESRLRGLATEDPTVN